MVAFRNPVCHIAGELTQCGFLLIWYIQCSLWSSCKGESHIPPVCFDAAAFVSVVYGETPGVAQPGDANKVFLGPFTSQGCVFYDRPAHVQALWRVSSRCTAVQKARMLFEFVVRWGLRLWGLHNTCRHSCAHVHEVSQDEWDRACVCVCHILCRAARVLLGFGIDPPSRSGIGCPT